MKPTLQLLLGLILILATNSCQSASSKTLNQLRETKFPSFEEIYTQVNKQITAPGKDCQFGLAKKADGYYLKIIPYSKGEPQTPKFLKAWDAASNEYQKLDLDKYLGDHYGREPYREGLQSIQASGKYFNLNYFYGYPDYTGDLIELMKDQEDLSNTELEMLGRAYSAEACDYIHPNQFGSEITATKDLSDPMYDKIDASRVSSFLRLTEQSLACYQKIKDKDPHYKTMIFNDLDLKVNHDLLNYYLLFKSIREDKHAEGMLQLANYKPDAIAYAKELLDDCAQNGVLITSGDTDTFPLWFVQDKLHYRTDVIVINYSLLQTPWYFDFIKHTTSIKSSLSINEYHYYYRSYVVLKESSEQVLNYPKWLAELRTNKETKTSDPKEVSSWMDMPEAPQNLTIEIQGTACNFSGKNGYMTGVDLCLLDLINSNKDRRFYTTSIYAFSNHNLRDQLAKRNMIYELVPGVVLSNWDKESNERLKENLQTHPIKSTSPRFSDVEKSTIYSKCFDWILMPKEEIEANKPVFKEFLNQLPFKTVIESSNPELAELYANALTTMAPEKASQFLDLFAPKALELLNAIDNQGILSEKDAETLTYIYASYVDKKINVLIAEPIADTELQKKVAKAVKNKLTMLLDNPLNTKNLSWTLKKLKSMKEKSDPY